MGGTRVFGRHEYSWPHKILSIGMIVGPFAWFAWFSLEGQRLAAVITLAVALGLVPLVLPLIFKYFTFVMLLDEEKLDVTYFRTRLTIPLEDIVDVRVKKMHTLDSVYIQDKSGNRISFERGVKGFDEVKRFLLETSERNNLQVDERRAFGSHAYHRGYRFILIAIAVAIWAGVAAAWPTGISQGSLTRDDINAVALTAMLIVAGIPWILASLHDSVFVVKVDQGGRVAMGVGAGGLGSLGRGNGPSRGAAEEGGRRFRPR